jgi:hypothetical protein
MSILYKDKRVDFPVKEVLTRKKEADKAGIMYHLEEYINSKGEGFKEELINSYQQSSDDLDELTLTPRLNPLNQTVFYRILDLFDIDDVSRFLTGRVKIPKDLKDKYVEDSDGMLNRVQTYTKQDYFELIVLATILRSVLPILGKYWFCKAGSIALEHRELTFIPIFNKYTKLSSLAAYNKLQEFAVKVFEKEGNKIENDMVRAITYSVPRDETSNWTFANFLFREIMSTSTLDDELERNIVTKVFNAVKSKLNKDTSNTAISEKKPTESYGDSEKDESLAESYRITTEIIPGFTVEINWIVSDIELILKQFPKEININRDVLKDAIRFISPHDDFMVTDSVFKLLGWIFHTHVVDCRSLKHIKLEGLKNLLCVGFAYLWSYGFKDLALILLSRATDDNFYNIVTNRSKITPELKDKLDKIYVVNKNKLTKTGIEEMSVAEIAINELADNLYKEQFTTFASREYIVEATGNRTPIITLSPDLKITLAKLVIEINRV